MSEAGWEHFEHQADIGLRAWGPDLPTALAEIGLALTGVVTDPAGVLPRDAVRLKCSAADAELLVVEWLDAVIYAMATHRMLFAGYVVDLEGYGLTAVAWGESVDRERHAPAVEVKGATLTGLKAEQDASGAWLLECVVDV